MRKLLVSVMCQRGALVGRVRGARTAERPTLGKMTKVAKAKSTTDRERASIVEIIKKCQPCASDLSKAARRRPLKPAFLAEAAARG